MAREASNREDCMFSHIMIGSNDIARSKAFYDAIIVAMGGEPGTQTANGRLVYVYRGGRLLITKPLNGRAATGANGGTIGFAVDSEAQADAWHAAGVGHGGTAIEDPPGVRKGPSGSTYLAYLSDPDGNKLCALYRLPA
jgi:catechol 2,3-dioxygenase-like lactoylglutathione lyase family enzyme